MAAETGGWDHIHVAHIPIPFHNAPKDLVIDPAAVGARIDQGMNFLMDDVSWDDVPELERILRTTILLWHSDANDGTFGECLETAIIWERG